MMLMPEWYFILIFLGFLTTLAVSWPPLMWFSPLLAIGVMLTLLQAIRGGVRARFHPERPSRIHRFGLRSLVSCFHLVQPAARLLGRVRHGLGPWNWRDLAQAIPLPTAHSIWSERWVAIELRLSQLNAVLKESGATTILGGDFDDWDFSIHGGLFGTIRVVAMVEERGNGRQLFRFRVWPKAPAAALVVLFALLCWLVLAGLDHAWLASRWD